MSGIPGSRVGGVGPVTPHFERQLSWSRYGRVVEWVERPEHAAAHQPTELERKAVLTAKLRRRHAAVARRNQTRTCTDPTCFCDWSQP